MLGLLDQEELKREVMLMAERTIDYTEVAIPNSDQYKKLRSRILRLANNLCRKIDKMGVTELIRKTEKENKNG